MNRAELKRRAREQLGEGIFKKSWPIAVLGIFIVAAICGAASTIPVATILLIGPLEIGLVVLFKNIKRNGSTKIDGLFDGFAKDFGGNLVLGIIIQIFIVLWSLLFLIPGIVKSYAYSMAYYLKSEHEDWDWRRCLDESIKLTNGHKMELFILDLSFIGWYLVGGLCLGIGELWAEAYRRQTLINFYEDITATRIEM